MILEAEGKHFNDRSEVSFLIDVSVTILHIRRTCICVTILKYIVPKIFVILTSDIFLTLVQMDLKDKWRNLQRKDLKD